MTRSRLPSGIPGLDIILNGGYLESGVYIIQGKPGAGKTIFANQLCFAHAARGGKAAYVTLLTESIPRMFQNLSTMSFFDNSRSPEQIYYVSAFEELESSGLQGLLKLIRGEIRKRCPSVLVLDGMVSAAERAESRVELRKFIHELQGYASLFPCTIFLLGTTSTESPVQVEHTMVEGVIDLADMSQLNESQRALQVRKYRGGGYIAGRHAFSISDEGVIVYPRLESLIGSPDVPLDRREPMQTGVAGLDALSGVGGLRSSSSTLLIGPHGAGKTILGAQFLSGSCKEQPGLLFCFNEPPADVLAHAGSLGLPLTELQQQGVLHTYWRPKVENILDEVGQRLLRMVEAHQVRRVFIDGLSGFTSAAIYPQRIERFVAALILELRRMGATSIFSLDACDNAGHLPLSAEGLPASFDNVIVLRVEESGRAVRRLLSVTKMRGCGFVDALHPYRVSRTGMIVGGEAETNSQTSSGQAGLPSTDTAGNERA